MKFILLVAIGLLVIFEPAFAQTIDQCSTTPVPGNPAAFLIQKLECRLQIEDNTRMAAEENLIIAQADKQIAEGKVTQINDRLGKAEQKLSEFETYWSKYIAGIEKLSNHINTACGWRGIQNKPMAELCQEWRKH